MSWVSLVGLTWVAVGLVTALIVGSAMRAAVRLHSLNSEQTIPDYFFQEFRSPVGIGTPPGDIA
jgi:hypothetical protein